MADVVKYGIQIPNRVFVGGVAFDTKEEELKDFFSQYGKVKECKIIKDNQSISRGFAFVTFECKHDAIQTQQLGTVFFNQKKLNLGPAIRQKGVVFNGANEFDNEPVLSTGVYIHPSGYSYTVAPNGVWYFHNSDGSPRARSPGAPSMSYSPTLVHKIQQSTQEHLSSNLENVSNNQSTNNNVECEPSLPVPVFHSDPVEVPYQTTQIMQNHPHQPTGYVHHTHSSIGSSNIHVAFQNMSISSHPGPSVPGHHVHLAASPTMQSPLANQIQTINSSISHNPMVPVQYTRVGDVYVPYYTSPPNIKHGSSFEGSPIDHRAANLAGHCHYPVSIQKPEYYAMMPNGVRDTYMYPVYDPYRPAYVYPQTAYNSVPMSESPPQCYYKKMYPKYPNGMKAHGKYGHSEKDVLNVETKCA